jgi:thiosulfate/3-mercaptopyruvate sulfurtransferase
VTSVTVVIPSIVGLEWWQQRADSVVLADVRWYLDGRSGLDAYRSGHLPGAVFVDLDRWLAAHDPSRGRHPLPEPGVFAEGMAQLGIGDDSTVVAYDDQCGVVAARLVWMLRSTGHDAALLDGGLAAYDGPLDEEPPARARATFTARPWPAERLADIEDAAGGGPDVVLDARAPERYRGETEPVDPRAGHIPGARNLPTRGHLDGDGRFLPVEAVRARFAAVGVTDATDVISYCGSGVTACHNLLALEHAGLGLGRLYPGSWSEYSAQPHRDVATDADG